MDYNLSPRAPATPEGWEALRGYSRYQMKAMGMGVFEADENPPLMLFPEHWYEYIPDDYEVENVVGEKSPFDVDEHSDDSRYFRGRRYLAYGLRPRPEVDTAIRCRGCGQFREHEDVVAELDGEFFVGEPLFADFEVEPCPRCDGEKAEYVDDTGG